MALAKLGIALGSENFEKYFKTILFKDLRKVFGGFRKTPVHAVNVSIKISNMQLNSLIYNLWFTVKTSSSTLCEWIILLERYIFD